MSRYSGRKFLLSLALCLVATFLATASDGAQDARIEVHYIDVGRGDATLVRRPDKRHLVTDSGELNSNYPQRMVIDRRW